jgi:hypothetical protein
MKCKKTAAMFLSVLTVFPVFAFASVAWAEITEKDVLVLGRLAGLLQGVDSGKVLVVVVGDGESRADAEAFTRMVGSGKAVGGITLTAKHVSLEELKTSDARVVLLPSGLSAANMTEIFAVASQKKMATISTSEACLQSRQCAIAIKTNPAVDIKMSASAAQATGVSFGSTFRMMIKEVP